MFFKKKNNNPLAHQEQALYSEIAKCESFIEKAPERIREQMEKERTTMPAPGPGAGRSRLYPRISCRARSASLGVPSDSVCHGWPTLSGGSGPAGLSGFGAILADGA